MKNVRQKFMTSLYLILLLFDFGNLQDESDIQLLILPDYDKNLPPYRKINGKIEAVTVFFLMRVLRDPLIKEMSQEIVLSLNFLLAWYDHRLNSTTFSVLPQKQTDQLWLPEVTFSPMKVLQMVDGTSNFRTVYVGGSSVTYIISCSLELLCEMSFGLYPMDIQLCKWTIRTNQPYKFVHFTWHTDYKLKLKDSAWKATELELPSFKCRFKASANNKSSDGIPNVLYLTMALRRELSTHILMTYFPSGLLVAVSWCSFIINPESVPGRITLLMTSLLTLVTMFNSLRTNLKASFSLKPIELWLIVCMSFVVGALMEYAVIMLGSRYLSSPEEAKHELNQGKLFVVRSELEAQVVTVVPKKRRRCCLRLRMVKNKLRNFTRKRGIIDIVALIVFPVAFLVFNYCYWKHNLKQNYQKWNNLLKKEFQDD